MPDDAGRRPTRTATTREPPRPDPPAAGPTAERKPSPPRYVPGSEPFAGIDASTFFGSFPAPLMLLDAESRLVALNREASLLGAAPPEDLIGRPIMDLVAFDGPVHDDPFQRAWRHGRPLKDLPALLRLGDNDVHVSLSTFRVDTPTGPLLMLNVKNASREQAVIRAIREVARRAARTADGLGVMGDGTSRKVEEIRIAMQEIAGGTQVQAEKVEETVDFIKELAMSIDTISQHAMQASSKAQAQAVTAREGTEVATKALGRMNTIIEGVEESGSLVKTLAQHVEEVEKILDFVKEISQQTNMLALNAAIEAARAGPHGRAFAVVADEVKRLSEHTRDSISEVYGIITEVKTEASEAVEVIQARTTEVKGSAEFVKEALIRFEEVSNDILESTDLIEKISHATVEQKRGATAIVGAIDEVAAVAEETSSSTERTFHLANEMAESVEALTAATHELTGIAGSLHGTLDRYFQQKAVDVAPWGSAASETVAREARRGHGTP